GETSPPLARVIHKRLRAKASCAPVPRRDIKIKKNDLKSHFSTFRTEGAQKQEICSFYIL
ncbi:MAG: hypothetical protein IJB20_06570, partial [Clostridia bacterium]|nr:hypothetical protein [Clostridia bacterium]